jgi:Ion channel
MAFERARRKVVSVFHHRCVYLFAALLALLVMVPFLEDYVLGRVLLNAINILILFSAAVAVSDSRACFALAVILGVASIAFQVLAFVQWEPQTLLVSRGLGAAFYFLTVSYLLTYVLRREVLTLDKLYGAASAFLMLGVIWAYFYAILLYFYPGVLAAGGAPIETSRISELLYFSFTVLTSTGFGDITPVHPVARMLCVLEQVVGVLFIAILIARLAGTYPPVDRR